MILADSSVWIEHLRQSTPTISNLAKGQRLLCHPLVIGEIALGSLKDRRTILHELRQLPVGTEASNDEVMALIESRRLYARGIGFIDAHLLASALLTDGTKLWSFDRRLSATASELNCAADLPGKAQH